MDYYSNWNDAIKELRNEEDTNIKNLLNNEINSSQANNIFASNVTESEKEYCIKLEQLKDQNSYLKIENEKLVQLQEDLNIKIDSLKASNNVYTSLLKNKNSFIASIDEYIKDEIPEETFEKLRKLRKEEKIFKKELDKLDKINKNYADCTET